jgi:hypothetical protein
MFLFVICCMCARLTGTVFLLASVPSVDGQYYAEVAATLACTCDAQPRLDRRSTSAIPIYAMQDVRHGSPRTDNNPSTSAPCLIPVIIPQNIRPSHAYPSGTPRRLEGVGLLGKIWILPRKLRRSCPTVSAHYTGTWWRTDEIGRDNDAKEATC